MKNKRIVRILSLVLVLIMTLSLAPVSASAETTGDSESAGWSEWWNRGIGGNFKQLPLDPIPVDEGEREDIIAIEYPAVDFSEVIDDLFIFVDAPVGALPDGTEMSVAPVSLDAVQAAVDNTDGVAGTVLAAADITFMYNGEEIQPQSDVTVTMTSAQVADAGNVSVVHLDTSAAELEGNEATDAEPVDSEAAGADAVTFAADKFSVYAIVDEGNDARLKVTFKKVDDTEISHVLIKKADLNRLDDIVYDPGAPMASNQLFRGWLTSTSYTTETTALTIDQVREAVRTKLNTSFNDMDEMVFYAMVVGVYHISFLDEDGVSIKTENIMFKPGDTVTYLVNQPYQPKYQDEAFQGWNVSSQTSGNISGATTPIANNTTITITGDVTFMVNSPKGYWLSFQQNGTGASYTKPQFVRTEGTDVTVKPADPTRTGYVFAGWYPCTMDSQGNITSIEDTQFTFGGKLTARVTLAAKWTPNSTADYTIIIWKQRVSDNKDAADADKTYDVWKAIPVKNGTVGQTVPSTVINQNGTSTVNTGRANPSSTNNVKVNGTEYKQIGFHYSRWDSTKTIAPEGNTVINVYYDRNLITINFDAGNNHYIKNENNTPATYSRNVTYTGLFDAPLTFKWPTQYNSRNNGNGTNTDTLWKYTEGNQTTVLSLIGSFKLPTPSNVTLNLTQNDAGKYPVRFYKMDENGNYPSSSNYDDIAKFTAADSYGAFSITDKYAGFRAYEYREHMSSSTSTTGFSAWKTARAAGWTIDEPSYVSSSEDWYQIEIRFERMKYTIKFLDGIYVDGNGVTKVEPTGKPLSETDPIYYQKDISGYNVGGSLYNSVKPEPSIDGYVFSGWYVDETCTRPAVFDKMPEGGMTVYAKWTLAQYRVFLHPNVPTSDTSLEWGDAAQAMNYRIDYGKTSSSILGERDDYELVGWYTDNGVWEHPFDFESTALNEVIEDLFTDYDKTAIYTDYMDKYGNVGSNEKGWQPYNSDLYARDKETGDDTYRDRTWITQKLDVYALWRSKLPGAKGITVEYDALDKGVFTLEDETTSTTRTDPMDYSDLAWSVGGVAPTCNYTDENGVPYEFKSWNLMKYVDGAWVLDQNIVTGQRFVVKKDNAKVEDLPAAEQTEGVTKKYTIRLEAVYGPVEAATTIDLVIDPNGGELSDAYVTALTEQVNNLATRSADDDAPAVKKEGQVVTVENLPINEMITLPVAAQVSRNNGRGYVLAGFTTQAPDTWTDGMTFDRDLFVPVGTNVGADLNNRPTNTAANTVYAVWNEVAYIYHSSNDTVETVPIKTLDATTLKYTATQYPVAERNTYTAGYDKANGKYTTYYYGGFSLYAAPDAAAAGLTFVPDGTVTGTAASNYWSRSTAARKADAWNVSTGTVIYLKEVPTSYLASPKYLAVNEENGTGEITSLSLLSVTDTNIYRKGGIRFNDTTDVYGIFTKTFTMSQHAGSSTAYNAKDLFSMGENDYLTVTGGTNYVAENAEITVQALWITYDSVTVYSLETRTLTINSNKTSIS